MTDKEIEAGIKRACECDCAPPSTGWTVNPFPIIRDYMERLKHRAEEAEHRAEVAECALLTACVNLIKDEEDNVNMELLTRAVYTMFLRKAEKELAEENND